MLDMLTHNSTGRYFGWLDKQVKLNNNEWPGIKTVSAISSPWEGSQMLEVSNHTSYTP